MVIYSFTYIHCHSKFYLLLIANYTFQEFNSTIMFIRIICYSFILPEAYNLYNYGDHIAEYELILLKYLCLSSYTFSKQ